MRMQQLRYLKFDLFSLLQLLIRFALLDKNFFYLNWWTCWRLIGMERVEGKEANGSGGCAARGLITLFATSN